MEDEILSHLIFLYGEKVGKETRRRVQGLLATYEARLNRRQKWKPDQRDAILITYPDQVQKTERAPLKTLCDFLNRHVKNVISGVHILPFYPWSSDDGFSVKDYRAVDPAYGEWGDVERLGQDFHLMFDAVINHASVSSQWFQAFLRDDPKYRDYFIVVADDPDLSMVVRPRSLPLLTHFKTESGEKSVWTTFSADQPDLNYRNPDVLLEIIDILLLYISKSASLIRLDAIAYLWKEIGTACIHLPQTYRIIQLFRAILNEAAPDVLLVTETNVPHAENISYFGDGQNTAQMVYNFTLPPMLLHTIQTGSSEALNTWITNLKFPSGKATFFNFLASHDGIGLNPLRGILPESQIEAMVSKVKSHGGLVSYKRNADGSQSPYELNINYFDALNDPNSTEPIEVQADRFLIAHAILLSLAGIPGIYFHSLFGSRGWPEGVKQTSRNRTINRRKFALADLENDLADPDSLRTRIFGGLSHLLKARASSPAFDPYGKQRVLEFNPGVFAEMRFSEQNRAHVLCLHNITAAPQTVEIEKGDTFGMGSSRLRDLISQEEFKFGNKLTIQLSPYQSRWLV